jgi:hypothetical protein
MSGTRPARGRLTDGRARRDGRQLGAEPCSARKTLRRRPGAARSLLTTRRGQKCAPADSCSCAGRSSERFRVLAASLLLRLRWGRNPSAPLADSADLKEKLELEAFWCGRLRARRAQAFEVGAEPGGNQQRSHTSSHSNRRRQGRQSPPERSNHRPHRAKARRPPGECGHAAQRSGRRRSVRPVRRTDLGRLRREVVAGGRRDHEIECVLRFTAVARGIGERPDQVEDLDHRAGPAVRNDQR